MNKERAIEIISTFQRAKQESEDASPPPNFSEAASFWEDYIDDMMKKRSSKFRSVSSEDEEEIASDVLLILLTKIDFESVDSIDAYLYNIIKYKMIRFHNNNKKRRQHERISDDQILLESRAKHEYDAVQRTVRLEYEPSAIYDTLKQAYLDSLSPKKRERFAPKLEVLYLYTFDKSLYCDHDDVRGVASNTLDQQRSRFRATLLKWFHTTSHHWEPEVYEYVRGLIEVMCNTRTEADS